MGAGDDTDGSCLSSFAKAESECGDLSSLCSQNGALEMRGQHRMRMERRLLEP